MKTARLMKVEKGRLLNSKIAFNYDDLQKRCDDYVAKVKTDVQAMLENARNESEEIKRNAYNEGFQRGQEEGFTEATTKIQHQSSQKAQELSTVQLQTALPALRAVSTLVTEEKEKWLVQWEAQAVSLSIAMAEKIIRHELTCHPEFRLATIKAALELVSGQKSIDLTLNPADREVLGSSKQDIVIALAECGEVRLIDDESVTIGGCRIASHHGTIDATIESQLRRLSAELVQIENENDQRTESTS